MKPIVVLGAGLMIMASGSFGSYSPPPQPKLGGVTPATSRPTSPTASGGFKPYKPSSTYSNRGGVNAYPSAPKPKGYIDVYGKSKR